MFRTQTQKYSKETSLNILSLNILNIFQNFNYVQDNKIARDNPRDKSGKYTKIVYSPRKIQENEPSQV